MQRKLLLFLTISLSLIVRSQTLYWVGGSGNFNDSQHWSLTTGGLPANITPTAANDLVFDDLSSSGTFIVNIVGANPLKSLTCLNGAKQLYFTGDQFSSLVCGGDFVLSQGTHYEANSRLVFSNNSSTYHVVNFGQNKLNAPVLFDNGNWDLQRVSLADNYQVKFNKGSYRLNNASMVAGNLEANDQGVLFESNHSVFYVKNNLVLGQNVSFNSSDLVLIAPKNNPNAYKVNSNVSFGSNAKLYNSNPQVQACAITYSFTNPTCSGQCDASITVGFDAGCNTGPYDLIFNTAATCLPSGINGVMPPAVTLNSLCACGGNLLDIFVFDSNGFVTQLNGLNMPSNPTPINLFVTGSVQPRCFGLCNGSFNITPSGGTGPYNVAITNGVATQTMTGVPGVTATPVTNLCSGVYTITVTDVKGCVRSFTTNLNQPPQLVPNGVTNTITCFGACNGSALVSPTGGTSPYTYSWVSSTSTPSTASTSSIGNLCPGVVTMTVTDSQTCTATYSATVTQPTSITLTSNQTNLVCSTICNGNATVTASGGTPGYTYSWVPMGSSNPTSTGLCAGPYTVTVTDNLNCSKQITFTLTAPPTLTASPTQTNVLCNGASTGSINLNPSGGTPGYTYVWSPPVSTTSTAVNLPAQVYSYTITDIQACPFSGTVAITEPPALSLSVSQTNVTCPSICNGTANANLSGGTSPYTYTWTPGGAPLVGQGTASVTNLCAGNFSLNVRDANNCSTSTTFTITQPPPIAPNVSTVAPTCFSVCNGVINSAPSGGWGGPYTFTLIPSSGAPIVASPPFNGLCAGNYTLVVGDNGCTRTQTVTLTQPNLLTFSLNATPINCFNQCSSTISSVINGGSPSYTVTWGSGPSPGNSQVNQCAGVHTATVTDSKGCTATASVNITSPPDMTVTINSANPNCNGQCNGAASTTVTGGTPNYTLSWSNGVNGNVNPNLCDGSYTLTATDSRGCVKTAIATIVAPPALILTPVNGTVSCAGMCDGTVSVVASGGTPGYVYNWSSVPSQTTASAVNLCAGNYNVSVTDGQGCLASSSANVSQPSVLTVTISNVKPSCNVCIGEATASGIGGTAPYSYLWSPGGQTVASPTDLCVGPQTVTVTDSRGCVATQTVQINQTIILVLTSNGATLACNGVCSGAATANGVGGVLPYTYNWTSPPVAPTQTTQTAFNLCVGTHTVVVTDQLGCSSSGTVSFAQPPAITLTVTKSDVTCNSACNGSVSVSASGGTGAISYQWQPGGSTASSLTGLCAGDYTLTATDANGCTQTTVVTIAEPDVLAVSYTNIDPTTCISADGSISYTVTGGTIPITATWVVPAAGGSANPLTNLPDGNYVLSVTDVNGCSQSFTTSLSDPLGPTVSVASNSIACFGSCSGSATLSITGASPFNVNWVGVASTSQTVTNLCVGSYVASVTDNNFCVTNQTVSISEPTQMTSSGVVSNVTCSSACSGSINLTVNGGTPGYSYTWTPSGGNVQDPTGLCAGNYSVTIGDLNNCTVTNTYVITQPSSLTVTFNKQDVLCNGGCTGSVRALVSGGLAPYTYSWTPLGTFTGSSLDTVINLCTGVYTVSITDGNNCVTVTTVSIGEPTVLTSTLTANNITCNGQCNGSASIVASGGVSPYFYTYNTTPAVNTQSVGALCPGTYVGTVTDANGCTSSNSFTITQPLPIVITSTVSNPKCNAACDGSVATTVSGGNPNYSYSWIPSGGNIANPTGLCAGSYTLVVTDDSLCTNQSIITLVNPPVLLANTSFTNPTCSGVCSGIVTANGSGGTAPYTYMWAAPVTNTQTLTGLCSGDYTVTVTDANACVRIQTVSLINPIAISLNPAVTPADCGVSNGSIDAVPVGGVAPYTYTWSAPAVSTTSTAINLGAGIYTVTVEDVNGCTATVSVPLSNSNGPSDVTITFTNIACNGQNNGAAEISNPVGGTAPYTLSWATPSTTNISISGLSVGDYTAQVVDFNGCIYFEAISITEPQLIDDNEALVSPQCFGNCNGSITLNPTGGNGGYTYVWTNSSSSTSVASSLCPGDYSVTITDSKGCTFNGAYNLPALTTITSNTMNVNNICYNNCDGSITVVNVAGGLPPYAYQWSDPLGQSSTQALGLCNGTYTVMITDANGCSSFIPGDVTSPSAVTFTSNISQPGCDMCNGAAVINPTGGTPTYTINWSNSQTGTSVTNLCAGVYAVQIIDGNGCLTDTNVVINSSSTITGENIVTTDETCAGLCNGSATVTAIGGVGAVSYNWVHNGSTNPSQTGLCAGTYFVNMIDANGCSRTASVVINSAVTLSVTSQITQSSCSSSTGSITVNVSGGTGVYTYAWIPAVGSTTNVATNLAPGTYTLTVTDGNGCSNTEIYSMGTANGPIITYSQTNITCSNSSSCDGSIDIVVNGGTPGGTISWSNGATNTLSIGSLCAGVYSVIVLDGAGCEAVQNMSITGVSPLAFSSPDLDNPVCANDCNGSLTVLPIGGTLPYTFNWSPGNIPTPTTNSLCAGNYTINITDANGCSIVQTYSLTSPATMTMSALVTQATCNNAADGSIDVTNGGGVPAYTYSWVPGGASTQDLTNVLPGTYSLTITDAGGCSQDTVLTIISTIVVNAIAGNDTSFCQNGIFTLDGSTSNGGLTYQWTELPLGTVISTSLVVSVTPATGTNTYVLTATNGTCIDVDSIIVASNPLPVVDAGPLVNIPLFGTATIGGSPTGPAGSTFNWLPNLGLDNPTGANPTSSTTITTIYTVSVTDANGCMNSDTVTVFVYPEIIIPNGFSPNSDGKNDTWMLDLITLFPDCEVEVYNRWGEQLFYSKGYPIPWNGQYKGKNLPVGTYYYVINLNHPSYPDPYTGPLTIFR